MKHGSTVIAFVEDPDGYKIELIQTQSLPAVRASGTESSLEEVAAVGSAA